MSCKIHVQLLGGENTVKINVFDDHFIVEPDNYLKFQNLKAALLHIAVKHGHKWDGRIEICKPFEEDEWDLKRLLKVNDPFYIPDTQPDDPPYCVIKLKECWE